MNRKWYKMGLMVIAIGLFALACGKTAKLKKEKRNNYISEGYTMGTITTKYEDAGCDLLISIESQSGESFLLPLTIDEQFAKNKKVVYFKYALSRAPQPEGCSMGQLIVIDDMKD